MRTYTYSEARQRFAEILDLARREDVLITRRGGETFRLTRTSTAQSPFDVPAVKTEATTRDILRAVKASRARR